MKTTLILTAALIACAAPLATADAASTKVGDKVIVAVARGDADGSGTIDSRDVHTMLAILFEGARPTVSKRALDHNGDGWFDIADVDAALRDLEELGEREAEKSEEEARLGDTNDDGKVDIADLVALAGWFTGGARYAAPEEAADLNQDGRVDITDLSMLAKALLG